MQPKLLRELPSKRPPRHAFGHGHEPHRLPLCKIRNTVKANLIQQKVAKKSKRASSLCFLGVLLFRINDQRNPHVKSDQSSLMQCCIWPYFEGRENCSTDRLPSRCGLAFRRERQEYSENKSESVSKVSGAGCLGRRGVGCLVLASAVGFSTDRSGDHAVATTGIKLPTSAD